MPYKLPLKNGTFRKGIIIQIGDNYGDIAPLPGFSTETLETLTHDSPSVKFALECVKHPIVPLSVPINALNVHRTGFKALKLKVGQLSVNNTVSWIKTTPKNIELRLDFNRQWPLSKLLEFSKHFAPTDFAYLEEPTKDFSDLMAFSRQTGFPIAMDESIPYVPYWEIPTLKALVVKPTILGYVPEPPPGVELIFSSAFESGVGIAHIARLAMQYNPNRPHGLDPYSHLVQDIINPRHTISNGCLNISTLSV